MKPIIFLTISFLFFINFNNAQSIEDTFSVESMKKDLKVFKEIRVKANSGLYKYRTKKQIDSIYNWADNEINIAKTYRDFYNIIIQLTDFEGSTHNNTSIPEKYWNNLKKEENGYFPYPLKLIENKVIINFENGVIPLGAEIITINGLEITTIITNLYKYYTTDGYNITGKAIGINKHFSKFFRFNYGKKDTFNITYKIQNSTQIQSIALKSISIVDYYKNVSNRYSKPFDEGFYKDWKIEEMYHYKSIDSVTSVLTINSFAIGENANSKEHKDFLEFLDKTFIKLKKENIKNLIVDIRNNGGGTDPNDLVTYEYLTQRNFSENKEAWISFNKIPLLRFIDTKVPFFLRPLGVIKHNKYLKKEFPLEKDGRFYQNKNSEDHQFRVPNKNAFTGQIYLLVSPRVASAGSLFAAMVASNTNTIVIGEETMGGYYGHNGHSPIDYMLPKSKITSTFSIVNIKQDVIKKTNQLENRGIIPDYIIQQSYEDFINHKDNQIAFTLELINQKN